MAKPSPSRSLLREPQPPVRRGRVISEEIHSTFSHDPAAFGYVRVGEDAQRHPGAFTNAINKPIIRCRSFTVIVVSPVPVETRERIAKQAAPIYAPVLHRRRPIHLRQCEQRHDRHFSLSQLPR